MRHSTLLLCGWAVAFPLLLSPGAACSCSSDERVAETGGAAGDASNESAGAGGTGSVPAGGGGIGGSVACTAAPKSPEIPKGWVRFPGLPCHCDVWMAPDPETSNPPPSWVATDPGVLELESDWADAKHRIYLGTSLGDAWQGKQYLAFLRSMGGNLQEVIVIRLPDNVVAFQARIPEGAATAECTLRAAAVNQGVASFNAWENSATPGPTWEVGAYADPPGPAPTVFSAQKLAGVGPYHAVSSTVAAWNAGTDRIDVFRLDGTNQWVSAWASTGASLAPNAGLFAWDDAVFFELRYDINTFESWVWGPIAGARPLVKVTGTEPGKIGSSCGISTDGETLVWTQASGWNGTSWDQVDVMAAPFTTDPSKLQPKKLVSAPPEGLGCVRWKVQAGVASTLTRFESSKVDRNVFLVRLADGTSWLVPNRVGRHFGRPLYITKDEMALEEVLSLPNDAGISDLFSWSIVRYPLSLLGAGTPP